MEFILPNLGLFFWSSLLFLIFFFILRRFAWGPILTALKEREDSIDNSLKLAEKARAEMEALAADNEKLLKEARLERDKIIREANGLRDDIIKQAKEAASKASTIEIEKAKQQIDSEKNAALAEIKTTAAALAVEVAEKILRKKMEDRDVQEKFAEQLISELSNN